MSTSALCAVHCTIIQVAYIVQRRNETRKRTYIRLGSEKAPEFIVSNNGGFGFSLNLVYCCLYFMYNFIFLFCRCSFCFQCATVQMCLVAYNKFSERTKNTDSISRFSIFSRVLVALCGRYILFQGMFSLFKHDIREYVFELLIESYPIG